MATLNFDATTVAPATAYAPLPAGTYMCIAEDSEIKPTNSGEGKYLQITWKVIEGEHSGRLVWERLNIDNPKQATVEIAYKTLSSICHAVGKAQISDSAELHGIPVNVKLIVRDSAQFGATNDIRGYSAVTAGATPAVATPAAAPAPQATPPAPQAAPSAKPPWQK